MKIYVVDDDAIQLSLATAALESLGYEDIHASECPERMLADPTLAAEPADIFFLDIMMPGIDGIETCRRLRASEFGANATIIMMTAMSDRAHIDAAFGAGADDYIMKPFDPTEMAHRVKSASAHRQPACAGTDARDTQFRGRDLDFARMCNLTQHRALEAYVEALDRGRASLSMATAFRLLDWKRHAEGQDDAAEIELVGAIAEILKSGLSDTSFVLSYFGEGIFVCITRRADPVVSKSLLRRFNVDVHALCGGELLFARAEGVAVGGDQLALVRNAIAEVTEMDGTKAASAAKAAAELPDLFSL